jgi:hypothetical protein
MGQFGHGLFDFPTDDNDLLGFSAPKTLYEDTPEANFREISKYSQEVYSDLRS